MTIQLSKFEFDLITQRTVAQRSADRDAEAARAVAALHRDCLNDVIRLLAQKAGAALDDEFEGASYRKDGEQYVLELRPKLKPIVNAAAGT